MKSNVFRSAQDRPLMSLSETRRVDAKKPRRTVTKDVAHSTRSQEQSKRYHAKIIGANPEKVRAMNPTKVIPQSRSFPGLVAE